MNKRQKIIILKFIIVFAVTAIAAFAMIVIKDNVNHSEAIRAMNILGQKLLEYKKTYGSLPPESYLDKIYEDIQGNVRLGKVKYRAVWITLDSGPDEIMAYAEKSPSLFRKGSFIVLRLNGKVEWMEKQKFTSLLESQQSQMEKLSLP
jgi:hypothetical protein